MFYWNFIIMYKSISSLRPSRRVPSCPVVVVLCPSVRPVVRLNITCKTSCSIRRMGWDALGWVKKRLRYPLLFFPQHGLLFSWPWSCLSSLLDFLFLDPLGKTAAIVFIFFTYFLAVDPFVSPPCKIFLILFPQLNVVGLLFSWPWPCLSSLLDFLFLDPLGKTAAIVFVLLSWEPLPPLTLNRDPFFPRRFLLHNDIFSFLHSSGQKNVRYENCSHFWENVRLWGSKNFDFWVENYL